MKDVYQLKKISPFIFFYLVVERRYVYHQWRLIGCRPGLPMKGRSSNHIKVSFLESRNCANPRVIPLCPSEGWFLYVTSSLSHQGRLKPKLLLVSRITTEWCTRCISGVTTINRSILSIFKGIQIFPWLNMAVAFRRTSKISTAITGGPSSVTAEILIAMDRIISIGWKRKLVVTSKSKSAWCTMCKHQRVGTAWNITCWRYMMKSSATTLTSTASQKCMLKLFNKPQPLFWAFSAMSKAKMGNSKRTNKGLRKVIHRLLTQRADLEVVNPRRGANSSQMAAKTKILMKKPTRISVAKFLCFQCSSNKLSLCLGLKQLSLNHDFTSQN